MRVNLSLRSFIVVSIPHKAYSTRNLAQHLAQFHSPYKTYVSAQYSCSRLGCKATFQWNVYKIAHERVHDNNLYRCVLCPYGNAQYDKLVIHQRTHFNTRDFVCDVCDKASGSAFLLLGTPLFYALAAGI